MANCKMASKTHNSQMAPKPIHRPSLSVPAISGKVCHDEQFANVIYRKIIQARQSLAKIILTCQEDNSLEYHYVLDI